MNEQERENRAAAVEGREAITPSDCPVCASANNQVIPDKSDMTYRGCLDCGFSANIVGGWLASTMAWNTIARVFKLGRLAESLGYSRDGRALLSPVEDEE